MTFWQVTRSKIWLYSLCRDLQNDSFKNHILGYIASKAKEIFFKKEAGLVSINDMWVARNFGV